MLLAFAAVGAVAAPVAEPQPEAKAEAAPADYGNCKSISLISSDKVTDLTLDGDYGNYGSYEDYPSSSSSSATPTPTPTGYGSYANCK